MKTDFRHIQDKHVDVGGVFYLYGNYKKTFVAFCDFICEKLRQKGLRVVPHFSSVDESLKAIGGQCDLFETRTHCFCIRGVEDRHLEKLSPFLNGGDNVFVLESGDYAKSKKITEHFLAQNKIFALASFRNDITLRSLCQMLLPGASPAVNGEIVRIIGETDEELSSFFKKISLLLEIDPDSLKEYGDRGRSFVAELDFIPLVRYFLQSILREDVFGKKQTESRINVSREKALRLLLTAEIKQKLGFEMGKSYLYGQLSSEN
ncbi:MAG: hypothetical protein LBT63_01325 [Holosporaceae bacterium]|jgi:hypothetical protein|nr:hypothetical protein [Holosporaceae bacterium]